MIYIYIIFIYLFAVSCTSMRKNETVSSINGNASLYVIDIDNMSKEKSINYSSYFKDVKTIILETNKDCLINHVGTIRVVDDFIVVMDDEQNGEVFVFNKVGHFLHKIGKVGQGPGEYIYVTSSSIDYDKKEIYLFDISTHCIRKYDIKTGRFISSIHIDEDGYDSSYIQYVSGKLYTSINSNFKKEGSYLLQEIDIETGEHTNSYMKASEYNKGWTSFFGREEGFFYPDERGHSKYVEMFMDTIVSIDENGVKPYLVVKDKKWITTNDINELIEFKEKNDGLLSQYILFEKKLSYWINRYFETENMICFQFQTGGYMPFVIYDKKTNIVRFSDLFQDDVIDNVNGVSLSLFTFADLNGVYGYVKTSRIPLLLELIHSGRVNPNLDKLDQLKKLSEDSNPVIFYYECK